MPFSFARLLGSGPSGKSGAGPVAVFLYEERAGATQIWERIDGPGFRYRLSREAPVTVIYQSLNPHGRAERIDVAVERLPDQSPPEALFRPDPNDAGRGEMIREAVDREGHAGEGECRPVEVLTGSWDELDGGGSLTLSADAEGEQLGAEQLSADAAVLSVANSVLQERRPGLTGASGVVTGEGAGCTLVRLFPDRAEVVQREDLWMSCVVLGDVT